VAQFENGKANVSLRFIPKDHPFYNLEGKDNIVEFYTDRYIDQPLIIKGAGVETALILIILTVGLLGKVWQKFSTAAL
jgi:aspartokinase/homoserine dehydrogenase 1